MCPLQNITNTTLNVILTKRVTKGFTFKLTHDISILYTIFTIQSSRVRVHYILLIRRTYSSYFVFCSGNNAGHT